MVPQEAPEHPAPWTDHVTAVLPVPVTVAVNCCCCPTTSSTLLGDTITTIGVDSETVAEADLEGFATEVAVTVTTGGFGTVDGAVYKPRDVIVPQ
jgi:hypothetical protein